MSKTFNCTDAPIKLEGFAVAEGGLFRRLPLELGERVNPGVAWHTQDSAGACARFATDSHTIGVHMELRMPPLPELITSFTADISIGGVYRAVFGAEAGVAAIDGSVENDGMNEVRINLPHYNGITAFTVTLDDGAELRAPAPHSYELPIVFYGSSITQGGHSSRPGLAFPVIVAERYDMELINFGMSGSARAEDNIMDYLATFNACVFVFDYDHNAPDPEFLEATHYNAFRRLRDAHPDMPIVVMSRPDFSAHREESTLRRATVYNTYTRSIADGDRHLAFIDGESYFEGHMLSECTHDLCHPNDIGFTLMAERLCAVIDGFGFKRKNFSPAGKPMQLNAE